MLASTTSSHEQGTSARLPRRTGDHPQISSVACPYHPLARTVSWASGRVGCLSHRWAQVHGQTTSGRIPTQFPDPLLNLPEAQSVRAFVCSVTVWALAVGLAVNAVAGRAFAQTTEQQVAPEEPAAAKEPAAIQPTISRSGPEPAPAIAPFDAEQAKRHQEAWAKHLGVPVELTNSIGMKLVLIPPGEFLMGFPESEVQSVLEDSDLKLHYERYSFLVAFDGRGEKLMTETEYFTQIGRSRVLMAPQHRVRLSRAFYLGVHEVTQEQYQHVMNVNPSRWKNPHYPVAGVSWDDAVKFCQALSALPDEKVSGRRYCLPTEAQWEYACRAGTATRLHFGNNVSGLDEFGWYGNINDMVQNSRDASHPVGQKKPNAWRLYDMHGNVWEWCQDWYGDDYYKNSPLNDPTGPDTSSENRRVLRGGGGYYTESFCLSSLRNRLEPHIGGDYEGFRIVAVLSGQQSGK